MLVLKLYEQKKAKIHTEESNGIKPVSTFSLPSVLRRDRRKSLVNVILMEDRKGMDDTASFSFLSEVYHNRPAILIKHSSKINIK